MLILFIAFLFIFFLWLILYSNRKNMVRWICKRAIARGDQEKAVTIFIEALNEGWINIKDAFLFANEYECLESALSKLTIPKKKNDMRSHLIDLYHFYFPKKG